METIEFDNSIYVLCIHEFSEGNNINLRCATWYRKIGFIYGMLFPEISNWERSRNDKKKEKLKAKYKP